MDDGTISFTEGLGNKALDSKKIRRKQRGFVPLIKDSSTVETPAEAVMSPAAMDTLPHVSNLSDPQINQGVLSPKHNTSSPARKLKQKLLTEGFRQDSEARMLAIVGQLEDELNNSEDPFVRDVVTTKLQGLQREWRKAEEQPKPEFEHLREKALFEEGLRLESEVRARLQQHQVSESEVQKSNPNPKVLFNARGNPYFQGDPSLGYTGEDSKPRYAPAKQVLGSKSGVLPNSASQPSTSRNPESQPKAKNRQSQPTKIWASLFRSQGPSSNMKLGLYPELKKGKNAVVELDVDHLDENCWSHCLVGHFLNERMDYRLANSTAHKLWGKMTEYGLLSVKSDNAGFLYFEFKDEASQLAVLEGGPWFFSQKFLVLQKWRRMMTPTKISPSFIPTWVKLHNLPPEC